MGIHALQQLIVIQDIVMLLIELEQIFVQLKRVVMQLVLEKLLSVMATPAHLRSTVIQDIVIKIMELINVHHTPVQT
jgi:hypothetical protein